MQAKSCVGISAALVPLLLMGCQSSQPSTQASTEERQITGGFEPGYRSPDEGQLVGYRDYGAEIAALRRQVDEANAKAAAALAASGGKAPAEGAMPSDSGTRRVSYTPDVDADHQYSSMAFPTGDRDSSPIMLYEVTPRSANRNEPFDAEYHVVNTTNATLQSVVLMASDYNNMSVEGVDPAPTPTANGLMWDLGDLEGGETRVIRFKGTASDVGTASSCLTVAYNNKLCAGLSIVEPQLQIAKTQTPEILRCEQISIKYVVSNPGSGVAENVRIVDQLPEGLTLADGGRSVNIDVGNLEPGASREYEVLANASNAGTYSSTAQATSASLSADSQEPSTVVHEPMLAIEAGCRDQQYIGRPITYTFDVSNVGDGDARNAIVSSPMPTGLELLSISNGGQLDGGNIVWNLGTLRPDQTTQLSYEVQASEPQTVKVSANVNAECAPAAADACSTEIIGIPAILLEVVDLTDPVEVGSETTYVITVTNQGTAPGTNVRVTAVLDDSTQYVSSSGETVGTSDGQMVTFAPVSRLAVGQSVEFRVSVRATAADDSRFLVRMESDQLTREPVQETESTNLYD